ncbi:cobalt ECF transporter T component CbiQ [Devosia ginsengisoli]|uniref:Cobalt ECF transporter T component CbiQ n=1 Tax=Devosia ginsengisoli TaxID=400770 RepID=A0A5B8LNP9_9HYPH|nr:cobalt ECF transporter T component CbiQ [Devosia ginsengisoli]QDZ09763.1 cobalt ECF transporter T component CbiQ [Devosia ginsengisoli]
MRSIDRSAHTNRWRRLPTAEKGLLALGMMVAALLASHWLVLAAILALAVGLALAGARITLHDLRHAASVPLGFIALSTLAQLITVSFAADEPRFGLTSLDGVGQALFIGLRSTACVAALLFLALTTPLSSILDLLRHIGVSRDLSDIALLMLRMIWLLLDCLDAGWRSQVNRLGHCGWKRSIRSSGSLAVALLPRVLSRAQRLNDGLASRGFTGDLRFVSIEQQTNWRRLSVVSLVPLALTGLALWVV